MNNSRCRKMVPTPLRLMEASWMHSGHLPVLTAASPLPLFPLTLLSEAAFFSPALGTLLGGCQCPFCLPTNLQQGTPLEKA